MMTCSIAATDRRLLPAVLAVAIAIAAPSAARAQGSDTKAAAEALFRDGRALLDKGDLAAAAAKFEASHKLDPSVGTLINLASCYDKLGRVASAWARYREVAELAARSGQTKRQKYAADRAAELEPRLPRLLVQVVADAPAALAVARDGTPVDRALWGTAVPVDPGEFTIEATAPGHKAYSTKVTASEGQTTTVDVPALEPEPRAADPTAETAPITGTAGSQTTDDSRSMSRGRLYLSLGTGVAGLALAGVGIGFGVSARGKWNDAQELCDDNDVCDPAGVALGDDARTAARISTVLVGVGALAIAGGVVLYLTGRPDDEAPAGGTAVLAPTAIGDGPGVVVRGEF